MSRLTNLFKHLSKQQKRDLETLAKRTDWRFDIVANLPPELVFLVFEKLDHCSAFSAQRVSRRWFDQLSNDLVTGTLTQSWRSLGAFKLVVPEGPSQVASHALVAEHEQAFRTGNAFSRVYLNISLDEDDTLPRWAYCEGYVAWLTGPVDAIRIALYHIESGQRSSFSPPDREDIRKVAISSELLLAFTHGGKCYVWAHHSDRPPYTIRLPSAYVIATHVSEDIAIILIRSMHSASTEEPSRGSIIVVQCDIASHSRSPANQSCEGPINATTHEFEIMLHYWTMQPQIMLDRAKSSIILVDPLPEQNARIYLAQFSLHGNVQYTGYLPVGPQWKEFTFHVIESWLPGRENLFNVWLISPFNRRSSLERAERRPTGPTDYVHAQYHPKRRSFEIKTKKILSYSLIIKHDQHHYIYKGISYWDMFARNHAKRKEDMRVVDLEEETCVYRDIGSILGTVENKTVKILGDEIFLVRFTNYGFDVWCFDKNLRMSGEDPIFRKRRERALQYRLKQQISAEPRHHEASESPRTGIPLKDVVEGRHDSLRSV